MVQKPLTAAAGRGTFKGVMWLVILIFLLPALALWAAAWILWFLVRMLLAFGLLVWEWIEDRRDAAAA